MNSYLSLAQQLNNDAAIEANIETRSSEKFKPKILYLPEGGLVKSNGLFNGGTITALIGREKSEYLTGLEAAIESRSEDRILLYCEAIVERIRKDTLRRVKISGLDDFPAIVDVHYGNSWVAKHLFIGQNTELAMSASVWSGGKLNDHAFRATEHCQKRSKVNVQVLLILTPPMLTKIERSVLAAAPDNLSEIHISSPSVAWSAAGVAVKYNDEYELKQADGDKQVAQHGGSRWDFTANEIQKFMNPAYEEHNNQTTVDQRQVQQEDTKQQQQQQQQYNQDGQNHQQQQQLQQQENGQHQQQQQEQYQNQGVQEQHQQQQQQQNQGEQRQHQHDNAHQGATHQVQQGGMWMRDDLNGDFAIRQIDEVAYASLLSRIDFQSMDATQSVKELLRLRENLLTIGMG